MHGLHLAPDHNKESDQNAIEIATSCSFGKTISRHCKNNCSVGNEAMVKWAASYFVQPNVNFKMGTSPYKN